MAVSTATSTVSRPPGAGGVTVASTLHELHAVLDALGDEPGPGVLADADALERAVAETERLARRVASLKLRLVACANRSKVAAQSGFSTTGAWLARQTNSTGGAATREADLAEQLDERLPATGTAMSQGRVSPEHAGVIAWAITQLPEGLSPDQVARVEESLVGDAARMSAPRLRTAARRALSVVERDQRKVDEHEDRVLRDEESSALDRCRLTMHDNHDGTVSGSFVVPRLAGDILRKTVQQLASPRRQRNVGDADDAFDHDGHQGGSARSARSVGAPGDKTATWAEVDWPHQYGLAFAQLLEHLPTDRLHGKVAATVVVTMTREQLLADLTAAGLDTGHDISSGDARRLACGAGILPAVLDGPSLPLDLGRTRRFFTEAQRTALATRYSECAVDGCDRPYAWTELHHETPYAAGGPTDLDRAVPMCGWHHRAYHLPGTEATIRTHAGTGVKTVQFHRRT